MRNISKKKDENIFRFGKKMYLCNMDRETYEKQKPFAGEKKPSMLRRCVGHDYTSRQMYMVTMVTEGRRPLFGEPGTGSLVYQKKQVFIAFFLCDFFIYYLFLSFWGDFMIQSRISDKSNSKNWILMFNFAFKNKQKRTS